MEKDLGHAGEPSGGALGLRRRAATVARRCGMSPRLEGALGLPSRAGNTASAEASQAAIGTKLVLRGVTPAVRSPFESWEKAGTR